MILKNIQLNTHFLKSCTSAHQLQTGCIYITFYSVGFVYEVHIYLAKYSPFCLKLKFCVFALGQAEFYDFMQRERSIMASPAWAKRLKKGNINHKAVGEWKAEIERRCAGETVHVDRYCMLGRLDMVGWVESPQQCESSIVMQSDR